MTDLDELITYWKDRLLEHPPISGKPWHQVVRETITALEELKKLIGE